MSGCAAARRQRARLLSLVVWLGAPAASAAEADPVADPRGIQAALEEQASSGAYPFCRDPGHVWSARERAACDLAPAAQARCPAFAAACARALPHETPGAPWLAALVRALGQVVFAALVVLAVALPLGLALRLWRARRPARAAADAAAAVAEPVVSAAEPPAFEHAAQVHLERARRLAEAGNFVEAVAEMQLGVVLRLDARGLIAARRGRTNGDYARELRSQPELAAAFGELTRATEAVQFGGRRLDVAGFLRLLQHAAPLLAALGLALAAPASAAQPTETRAAGLRCGSGADEHGLSCALLAPSGAMTQRFRPLDGAGGIQHEVTAMVILPNALQDGAWAALEHWVEEGGVAVLTSPSPLDEDFGVERAGRCGAEAEALVDGGPAALFSPGPALLAPLLRPGALCSGGRKYIAYAEHGEGRFVFLPSPELLSNASLVAGQNARLLAELLDLPAGRVEIVGSWTRELSRSPLGALTAAGLGPWLGQLLLLALAFAAYRGVPFGRRVELPANRRRRFSEHVQALGQRWAEQRASRSALAAYAAFASDLLRERVPGASSGVALARAVAAKTGRPEDAVARTLELARRAQSGNGAGSEDEHLQALRELGRLIEDVGGPR